MRRWRLRAVSGFVSVLSLGACGSEGASPGQPTEQPEQVAQEAPRRHQAGTPNPHAPASPRPAPLARVARGGERGRSFDSGAVIRSGTNSIDLDLREGARVSVEPGAEIRLLDESRAQIAVARGLVHVVLPPLGSSPRPPLRVGTPSGTLRLNGSGDAWALVLPDGRAWFAVTGGLAEVLVQREDGTDSIALRAGQALVAGAQTPTEGPEGEAEARAAAQALFQSAPDEAPRETALNELVAQLDAAIASTRDDYARGEALQAAHREAVENGNGHEALQAIVRFSQGTQVRREALLLVYERVRSYALRLGVAPDPGALRRREVRAALRMPTDAAAAETAE